jgi:hypothetical protein
MSFQVHGLSFWTILDEYGRALKVLSFTQTDSDLFVRRRVLTDYKSPHILNAKGGDEMRLTVHRRRRGVRIRLEIGKLTLTVEYSNTARSLLKTARVLLYN